MENESIFTNFKREIQTLNYAELNYLISDIMLEIKKRSYNEGMVKGMTSYGSAEEVTPGESEKAPQQIRDEIVEKAKRDLNELCPMQWLVEYIVNKDKRTVVALIRFILKTNKVEYRGIAKCDPSDCFNANIGKAIALRRALGLEVPTEYLNAPQPTEVRVGDVVKSLVSGNVGEVTGIKNNYPVIKDDEGGPNYTFAHPVWNITDDSREGVTG